MPISKYLLSTSWDPIFIQPPLRFELFCVVAPDAHGAVYGTDRNCDELTGCDGDAVHNVIVSCLESGTEWDYVIIHGLEKDKNL